jgi:hypothetical protein
MSEQNVEFVGFISHGTYSNHCAINIYRIHQGRHTLQMKHCMPHYFYLLHRILKY